MFGNPEKPKTNTQPGAGEPHKDTSRLYVPYNYQSLSLLSDQQDKSTVEPKAESKRKVTTYDNGVDIFLDYARTENFGTGDSHPYFQLLSGDGHALNNCSAEEVHFAIHELIQDSNISWSIKASMFHELMDTATVFVGKKVIETLIDCATKSVDYFIQAQALEALTYVVANEGNFFWSNPDIYKIKHLLSEVQFIEKNSSSYFVRLRAQIFLKYMEAEGMSKLVPRSEVDDDYFEITEGTMASFGGGFDEIKITDVRRGDKKLTISDLTNDHLDKSETIQALFNFNFMSRPSVRDHVEKDFGVELKNLNLKEQYQFLNYIIRSSTKSAEKIKEQTSRLGINFARTFLSLERGDKTLGDDIVTFAENGEIANTVFKYFGELLDSADRAEALVREVTNCEGENCAELAAQVRENILNRAQKDLETAVRAQDLNEVVVQIENYVATAKEYVALLQEVGAGKIETVASSNLTPVERERMMNLLQANYRKAYPKPEEATFKVAVAGSLEKSFNNPTTTFKVLRDKGRIISYNRFDTLRDHTGKAVSYFGSFNADPVYSGVGGIMLEETIREQLANGNPMMAHCDPTQAITRKYIEDGFVATGYYALAGKPSFEIWRSQESSAQLESKNKTTTELLNLSETKSIVVREQNESENYPELQNDFALTRYFTNQGKTYVVFEKLPTALKQSFTLPQEELKQAA